MKRRSSRRTPRNSPCTTRSPKPTRPPKTKHHTSKSNITIDYDEVTKKEINDDLMSDIMTDHNGCHHCRICNHTFRTKVTQHWIPQWISHKSSKRHQNNKSELLNKMGSNSKISIPRPPNDSETESDSEMEREEEDEDEEEEDESSYHESEEDETESDELTEREEEMIIKPKTRKKRLKLTLKNNKSKHGQKNRYKVNCPYCDTMHMVQIPLQNFQLKNVICIDDECNKQYWIQIKDNKPIITKQYPFTSANTNKKLKLTLNRHRNRNRNRKRMRNFKKIESESDEECKSECGSKSEEGDSDIQIISSPNISPPSISPPRKKLKLAHQNRSNNVRQISNNNNRNIIKNENGKYYDDDIECMYEIPNVIVMENNKYCNDINNMMMVNNYIRPYNSIMSHIEMLNDCSRSLCSDFISGNCHCWEAVPLILNGNIRMASIGYMFECVWCNKQICFVEEKMNGFDEEHDDNDEIIDGILIDDSDNNNNNNNNNRNGLHLKSIEHQARQIELTLFNKWKLSENMPIYSMDGPSYSRVPFSLNNLKIKDRIMASDGTNWLPAWIEKINSNNNKVLVHFKGWNSRWDKWYNINSGMLKTINEYRKEKKLHSATRNENIYQIMKQKYPIFIPTNLYESEINKKRNKNNILSNVDIDGVIDAEIVMMHDKNEIFMAVHELPIHEKNDLILCPPMFYCQQIKSDVKCDNGEYDNNTIIQLVRKCFMKYNKRILDDTDILLIYKCCQSKIEDVFFTLYCLKTPQRLSIYLNLLKNNEK